MAIPNPSGKAISEIIKPATISVLQFSFNPASPSAGIRVFVIFKLPAASAEDFF
jgi:hypothetical protein